MNEQNFKDLAACDKLGDRNFGCGTVSKRPDPYDGYRGPKVKERFVRILRNMPEVHVSGGPFHYQMRAGTYGEQYDEAPWRVVLGIADVKERSGLETNPMKCRYENRVLVNNWLEERRDRQHIKYDNAPKLSEYGYVYKSEYGHAYTKPSCNKARDVLLRIKSFPMTAHPGHQPDLDVPVINYSAPKPEGCCKDEQIAMERRAVEVQKRYDRHDRELSGVN